MKRGCCRRCFFFVFFSRYIYTPCWRERQPSTVTVQNPACYTAADHSPPPYTYHSSSPRIADAQNMVKQYAFMMKSGVSQSPLFFFVFFLVMWCTVVGCGRERLPP